MSAINSRWTRAQSYNILCSSSAIKPGYVMLTIKRDDSVAEPSNQICKYKTTMLVRF